MTKIKASELESWKGKEVGVSDWVLVDQDRINTFADCTEEALQAAPK